MLRRASVLLALVCLLLIAAIPFKRLTVNFKYANEHFHAITSQYNSPLFRFYFLDGEDTFDATGLTLIYKWRRRKDSGTWNSVTGTVSSTYGEVQLTTNQTQNSFTDWYAVINLTTNNGSVAYAEGKMSVKKGAEAL